jgi:ABC-type cobalt transport system, ATPase component
MTASLLELRGIGFGYPGGRRVLDGVDLDLRPGERLAVVGGNGAGKTTLLHLIVGLRKASAGTIIAFGRERRREADFHAVRARAGLLFQDPDDQLFCPTVIEDVAFGPLNLGRGRREALAMAERTLTSLGLDGFGGRITHKLSGGEKRLVSLAAVLAMQPDALLLDEPTNALDTEAEARLVALLQGLPQAMLIVSHDARLISRLASRAVRLSGGRLEDTPLPSPEFPAAAPIAE